MERRKSFCDRKPRISFAISDCMDERITIAIVGGTGSLGHGLALRLARPGIKVTVGSPDPGRAQQAADELNQLLGGGSVEGKLNSEAIKEAEFIVIAVPYEGHEQMVRELEGGLKGKIVIDAVVPDYYALRPKKCMGGWGRQFFNISPAGKVLPCHAAESITGLEFESVRSNHSIAWIWQNSEAFNRYRGTGWMKEPCKSQAFALTGDAGNTDPACTLSPMHEKIFKDAEREAAAHQDRFLYRNFAGGTLETEGEHGA